MQKLTFKHSSRFQHSQSEVLVQQLKSSTNGWLRVEPLIHIRWTNFSTNSWVSTSISKKKFTGQKVHIIVSVTNHASLYSSISLALYFISKYLNVLLNLYTYTLGSIGFIYRPLSSENITFFALPAFPRRFCACCAKKRSFSSTRPPSASKMNSSGIWSCCSSFSSSFSS